MRIPALLLTLLCSALTVPAVRAADMADDHDHTELGDHMDKMGRAYRTLGREVADPAKNEDALRQVEIIKTNAEAALKLQPAKTADIAADQRAKFVADYQQEIKSLVEELGKLETALKAGHNDEAAAIVKSLKKLQDDGHKQFQKKKEKQKKASS